MMITIAGCGALGSLFALRLLEAGHAVQAYQRSGAQLQALRAKGIRLEGDRDGTARQGRLQAVSDDPEELAPTRLVIALVKAYSTEELRPLKKLLTTDGLVLTLQNGLGNAEALAGIFGAQRVAAGVATYGAFSIAPGVIGWGGDGQITLGPWNKGVATDWVAGLLQSAGLQVVSVGDPRPAIWGKLAINAMLNTVTALTGMRNGATRSNPAALELMQHLGRETVTAAGRAGISLDFDTLWPLFLDNLQRTAGNRTSMLQDVTSRRRTEIDMISGRVLDYARDESDFPYTRAVYALLKAIDHEVEAATG
ncbi:MAG: 2-dehydropantoate 2-reductase [Desulfuromonadales bacterium]|nr:2-dehydropantoate 2-reductase [Desulfuromonadales bacterium]